MLSKGIDTTIRELIAQLPKGLNGGNMSAGDFEKLIAPLAAQISSAIVSAAAVDAPPAALTGSSSMTGGSPAANGLNPFQLSLLRDKQSPNLDLLSGDLKAGDAQYNQREDILRGRLDLTELERKLQDEARALDVTYDRSDLEGILRNAGYDATHLGATERYMAAIEKYVGEARNNYRQRSSNTPGQLA